MSLIPQVRDIFQPLFPQKVFCPFLLFSSSFPRGLCNAGAGFLHVSDESLKLSSFFFMLPPPTLLVGILLVFELTVSSFCLI